MKGHRRKRLVHTPRLLEVELLVRVRSPAWEKMNRQLLPPGTLPFRREDKSRIQCCKRILRKCFSFMEKEESWFL